MTKKDYIAIAKIISMSKTRQEIIKNLACLMFNDNNLFNKARFIKACGDDDANNHTSEVSDSDTSAKKNS